METTFSVQQGSSTAEREISVGFSLQGEGPTGWVEAEFILSEGASFSPEGFVAPAGWACSDPAADIHRVRCTTQSLDRDGVSFHFGVRVPGAAQRGTLDFGFSGHGIAAMTFTNEFN